MVGDAEEDVDGAEVTALRESLIGGLHRQVEPVLRLKVQSFDHTDGAQLRVNGEDVVDIPCREKRRNFALEK